jgi:DNA (cytosine-5)-methyltransferase 1
MKTVGNIKNPRGNLEEAVYAATWPTPKGTDWKDGTTEGTQGRDSPDLGKVVGQSKVSGSLNPTWVEWLMGFPSGWTDLEV